MKFMPAPMRADTAMNSASQADSSDWKTICDLHTGGVVFVDANGLVVYLNRMAESLNEVRAQEWIGNEFVRFLNASCLGCDALRNAWRASRHLPDMPVNVGGRTILISAKVLRDERGLPRGYLFFQHKLPAVTETAAAPSFVGTAGAAATLDALYDAATLSGASYQIGLRAMNANSRVLLLGESGTGKTRFAQQLHRGSSRRSGQFVHVSCAGIPDSLFESEMFGYERGSFTGAHNRGKAGLIEAADGGTLFLDEIGEMPLALQAKLLLVLESGQLYRLGATQPKTVDIQVIAATNRDLDRMVAEGHFRRDLYYRLSVITLQLLPLREQRELISPLLDHFVARYGQRRGRSITLSDECRTALLAYDFPGNVRELQNIVEYISVVADELAHRAHLPARLMNQNVAEEQVRPGAPSADSQPVHVPGPLQSLKEMVRQYEAEIVSAAISRYGSKRKAAEVLQTNIATIVRKSRESA